MGHQLEDREVALRQLVLLDVDLEARAAVGDDEEVRLAEAADRALESAAIDGRRRGETLSIEEFASLAAAMRATAR